MPKSMPPIKPIDHLTEVDQAQVSTIVQQAADWLFLFDFTPTANPSLDERLSMILALHQVPDFRSYVKPFLRSDDRITAFEDAVADRLFQIIGQKALHHV